MEGFFNFVSLEIKQRYTLGTQERLKSQKAIGELFKEGLPMAVFPLRVIYQFRQAAPLVSGNALQAGFTVSTRHFKKASDRNRIRRLMKESYRLQKGALKQHLVNNGITLSAFFIYVGKELPNYEVVLEKTAIALQRLIKLTP